MSLVLDSSAYLVWQLAGDLGGVDALDVIVEALPLGDPGPGRVGQGDETLEDLARAALDGFGVVLEVQEVLAVALVAHRLARPVRAHSGLLRERRRRLRRRGLWRSPQDCIRSSFSLRGGGAALR